ncbi:MAG: hypothetical protein HY680_03670 [Chloroflexi bacterium]|nr:hypothetical protein [Chloroflexota bacterium]
MSTEISEARIREIVQEELAGPMVFLAGVIAESTKRLQQSCSQCGDAFQAKSNPQKPLSQTSSEVR